jgi:hypothetical protein
MALEKAAIFNSDGVYLLLNRPISFANECESGCYDQKIVNCFTASIKGVKLHLDLERSCQFPHNAHSPLPLTLVVSTHSVPSLAAIENSSSSTLFVWSRVFEIQTSPAFCQHHHQRWESKLETEKLGEFFASAMFNLALYYHSRSRGSDAMRGVLLYKSVIDFCHHWRQPEEKDADLLTTLQWVALNNLGVLQYNQGQSEAYVSFATLYRSMEHASNTETPLLSREDIAEMQSNCILVLYQRRHGGTCAQAA